MQNRMWNGPPESAVQQRLPRGNLCVYPHRVSSSWQSRHGWITRSPLLLASVGLHALILLVLFFVVPSTSNGSGTFGFSNGDAASAIWIRGDGSGNGRGKGMLGDTVLTDDEAGDSHDANQSMEVQPAKKELPLLDVVQTDPQSVFDADASDSENSLKDALSVADAQRQTVASAFTPTKTAPQEIDGLRNVLQKSSAVARDSDESDVVTTTASNRAGSGLSHEGAAGGQGVGAGLGEDGQSGAAGNRIAFFGLNAKAKRVVYVIDASESMRNHNAMELARQELWASLQGLTQTSQFQIVFFNLTTFTLSLPNERLRLLPATSQNLRQAKQFLTGIQPDSGTDRFAAISQALRLDPEVVYLLTDADDPVLSAKDLSEIQRANKRRAVIHVVEFGVGGDLRRESFLKRLARENHGMHWYHDLTRASR